LAGAKKSPPPAFGKKDWPDDWVVVLEGVEDDFSELDFIMVGGFRSGVPAGDLFRAIVYFLIGF
jgi:hypothetical protein